jgi:hypothetical protein
VQLGGIIEEVLLTILSRDSNIQHLQLSFPLPLKHVSHLATGIAASSTIRRLSLKGSRLKDCGLQALRDGLLGNSSLEEVSVAGCALTAEGARVLATVMKQRVTRCGPCALV